MNAIDQVTALRAVDGAVLTKRIRRARDGELLTAMSSGTLIDPKPQTPPSSSATSTPASPVEGKDVGDLMPRNTPP